MNSKQHFKDINSCAFCDDTTNITKEHVIPLWLQKTFNLSNQKVSLWNGTSMPYRQAVIPACFNCNTERFSILEEKIKNNTASENEYYIWALKIRYGMTIRDTLLDFDQKDISKGFLLPKEIVYQDQSFFKPVLKNFDKPGFTFYPNPFGSVFIFKKQVLEFDFIDIPQPYKAVGITLPNDRILVVLLGDRGVTKRIADRMEIINFIIDNLHDFNLRLIVFSLLRLQNHVQIPNIVKITSNGAISEAIPNRLPMRLQKLNWYKEIANYCGLTEKIAVDSYKADAFMDQMDYIQVT